jgi:hypothetical protein
VEHRARPDVPPARARRERGPAPRGGWAFFERYTPRRLTLVELPVADDRFGLDLDEPPWIEQPGDHDHRRRRADTAEHLAVDSAYRVGVVGAREVGARAHDVSGGRDAPALARGLTRFLARARVN